MDAHPARLGPRLFRLDSAGVRLGAAEFAADERLYALAAEDVVWTVSVIDWRLRRPPGWQLRRMRRWAAEGVELERRRDALRRAAIDCGAVC